MANHKSAEKRKRQNAVRNAAAAGDKDAAAEALKKAVPYIDKTATKGVIHKATASRKISRLTKLVNSIG